MSLAGERWPPYASTIILVTVATRLVFTVPFSVWAKNRQWRKQHIVGAQIASEMPAMQAQAQQDMKRDGFRTNEKDAVIAEIVKRTKPIVAARSKELDRQHRCGSLGTTGLILTQVPLFVATTAALNAASAAPTVLDSEAAFSLASLAAPDATMVLPVLYGLVTLVNVESARWFLAPAALEREKKVEAWTAARRAKGEVVLKPQTLMRSALRALVVPRILFASLVPGSVELYWLTSATFGLFQSWLLDYLYLRRPVPTAAAAVAEDAKTK